MTPTTWAALPSGTWGLTRPTVLTRWESLQVRESDLPRLDFDYIKADLDPELRELSIPTITGLRVEHRPNEPGSLTVFKTSLGRRVPMDSLGFLQMPVPARPSGRRWAVHASLQAPLSIPGGSWADFQRQSRASGGINLLTGDLDGLQAAVAAGQQPRLSDFAVGQAWIGWVPLGDYQSALAAEAIHPLRRTLRYNVKRLHERASRSTPHHS